jgi:putative endonuclease
MYWVYVVRCSDGSLYAGMTGDLQKRLREHVYRLPACAKYTRSHQVVSLAALWETETHASAARLEALFKTLPRPQKLALIETPSRLADFFPSKLDPAACEPVVHPKLEDYVPSP